MLRQDDTTIRTKAIFLCQKLIEAVDLTRIQKENFLSEMGLILNGIEEGKSLAQQIVTLLQPKFEQLFSASDPWDEHPSLVEFFMQMGSESQQLKIIP